MLIEVSDLKGFKITTMDGSIGTMTDFFFDDESWALRWISVETGTSLCGREILLPILVLGHADSDARCFPVCLTIAKAKDSPAIDTYALLLWY
jgi:hypothetical protein